MTTGFVPPLGLSSYYYNHPDSTEASIPVTQHLPVHSIVNERRKASTQKRPKKLDVPNIDPELYIHRRNTSPEALGTIVVRQICGKRLYFSSDFWIGAIPMGITIILVASNMALVWHEVGWREYIFTLCMLTMTFSSYWLCATADPGIYPRLKPGEVDPLEEHTDLVYCRICKLRRPPRAAHCYSCNVCVLEHDHHCNVLGGCIGRRNLRWFTTYLVTCSSSTMIGIVWLLRYLFTGVFVPDATAVNVNTSATTTLPPPRMANGRRVRESQSSATVSHLLAILVLMVDFLVVLVVGSMAVLYIYLTLTSTTRRESQQKENSAKSLCHPRLIWRNLRTTSFPPPSLLEDGQTTGETVQEKPEKTKPEAIVESLLNIV